jgi:hypothetical protein
LSNRAPALKKGGRFILTRSCDEQVHGVTRNVTPLQVIVKKLSSMDKRTQFLLWITDFFHGHWEDPEWGKTPIGQLSLATAIHQLASNVSDPEMRKQLQQATTKAVATAADKVAKAT